ncbi:unnamed protein product [Symbiodinium sp. KB8]|nr:unnamed protein product [Symbiodinium sp. KB8]
MQTAMKKVMKSSTMKAKTTMKAKAMKAMKKKAVSKIATGKRAKSVVFRGSKEKTSGGLAKSQLMKNKRGKVVSKKMHAKGKTIQKFVQQWLDAVMTARKELGIKGFCAVGGKSAQGKALYAKAKDPNAEQEILPSGTIQLMKNCSGSIKVTTSNGFGFELRSPGSKVRFLRLDSYEVEEAVLVINPLGSNVAMAFALAVYRFVDQRRAARAVAVAVLLVLARLWQGMQRRVYGVSRMTLPLKTLLPQVPAVAAESAACEVNDRGTDEVKGKGPKVSSVIYQCVAFRIGDFVTYPGNQVGRIVGIDDDGDLLVRTDHGRKAVWYISKCSKTLSAGVMLPMATLPATPTTAWLGFDGDSGLLTCSSDFAHRAHCGSLPRGVGVPVVLESINVGTEPAQNTVDQLSRKKYCASCRFALSRFHPVWFYNSAGQAIENELTLYSMYG